MSNNTQTLRIHEFKDQEQVDQLRTKATAIKQLIPEPLLFEVVISGVDADAMTLSL